MKTTKLVCINNDHELANGFNLTVGKVYEYRSDNDIFLGYIIDDKNWTFAFNIDGSRPGGTIEFFKVFKTLDEIRDEKINDILK